MTCARHARMSMPVVWCWRVVFLVVWPIQPHFRLRICLATGSCPALFHRSSLLTLTGHLMLKRRLRQLLMNVWIFYCVTSVFLHVSEPYRTNFYGWISMMPKCSLALQRLPLLFQSRPTTLHRYANDSTCVINCPPTVTSALAVVFIFIISVFFLLILRPVPADVVARRLALSCIWLWLWERSVKSSAKSRSSSCVQSVHCIPLFLPAVVVFMIQSVTSRKRKRRQ